MCKITPFLLLHSLQIHTLEGLHIFSGNSNFFNLVSDHRS
jgi:hypothetical protein